MAGTITNSGTVTATSGHLLVGPAGATLTGGGSLTLTSAATNEIAAGGLAQPPSTNVNDLISGRRRSSAAGLMTWSTRSLARSSATPPPWP